MPTYEYECLNCGHNFEAFQSMNDSALKKCPKCSKLKLKRLIGKGSGIIFKGSGFYATDYRKPDKQESKKQEKKNSCSECNLSTKNCPNANK